jgi:hypothetical protein
MDFSGVQLNPWRFAHYEPPQIRVADNVGRNNDDGTPERDYCLAKTGTDSKGELVTSASISKMAPPLKSKVAPPLKSKVAPPLKSIGGQHSEAPHKLPG